MLWIRSNGLTGLALDRLDPPTATNSPLFIGITTLDVRPLDPTSMVENPKVGHSGFQFPGGREPETGGRGGAWPRSLGHQSHTTGGCGAEPTTTVGVSDMGIKGRSTMPLEGEAKTAYQREYMRRRRAAMRATTAPGKASKAMGAEPELTEPTAPVEPITLAELLATIDANPFHHEMQQYRNALRLILADKIEPLMFCGGTPGIGKTYELMAACDAAGLEQGTDWAFVAPGTSPHSLVQEIYDHRACKLIVFDDHDKLLRAEVAQEVIKAGWGPQRRVHWGTKESKGVKATHPPSFAVNSLLIWLSNHDAARIAEGNVNLEAIFDRGEFRNIRGTNVDLFRYTMHKALYGKTLTKGYPFAVKLEAIQWFNNNRNRLKKLSLRGMQSALMRINETADSETDKHDALELLLWPEPVRDIPGFEFAEIAEALAEQEDKPLRIASSEAVSA